MHVIDENGPMVSPVRPLALFEYIIVLIRLALCYVGMTICKFVGVAMYFAFV